jgi:Lon protease-like protein
VTGSGRELPLFPLEQVVLFPGMSLPLRIFEERYKVMIGACHVTDQVFGVLLIRSGREVGTPVETERVGCTARMLRVDRFPDGRMNILTVGEQRFRLRGPARSMPEGYLVGNVELLADAAATPMDGALVASVGEEFGKYEAALLARTSGTATTSPPALPADPIRLSYRVAGTLHVHHRERQQLLEIEDVGERLRQELRLLRRENRPAAKMIGPFSVN